MSTHVDPEAGAILLGRKSKPPTKAQLQRRRADLPAYLQSIRRQAIYGARAADGVEPEVHRFLLGIVAHCDDGLDVLNGKAPFAHDDALAKAD